MCRQECKEPESEEEAKANDTHFTHSMYSLSQVLALMSTFADRQGPGLKLEFSARSPSDLHHVFKAWDHLQDDYPHLAGRRDQDRYMQEKLMTAHEL